ncbi:sensor histidine kinase [Terasakiella sp. A23]|uniref:sensor histidine kinase n=1 Tax=Terasakiella sp. FCG-A23 TaxID=3080561 RepID=UPI00295310D8|nr:sensor histidine kinase [Terasakiella sp. A23]MDV7339151.1 sensor histidine kinase [Terasakiella sp. A23]
MKLSRKIFIITFTLSILPLLLVALHTTEQTLLILKEREVASAEQNARAAINEFSNEIDRLKNLIRILAATRAAKLLPELPQDQNRETLQLELIELFRTILRQNPSYDQVRLIGANQKGLEVVRVDRHGEGIANVAGPQLQEKGSRYYFKETIKLSQGETFISHIDLNREFGVIEQPLRPMIRVATPVTSADGENVGIVIINVNFHKLVQDHVRTDTPGDFLVTNANGEYLHNKDQSRTFAFEFGNSERIQRDFHLEEDWLGWVTSTSPLETKRFETPDHFLILSKVDIGFGTVHGVDRKWIYGYAIPRSAIEGIAKRLDEHLYISLFAIAASIAIASSYITSSVLKPVEQLTETANKIALGDPSVDSIDVTGKGEIRILSDALSRMLSSLREAAKTQELATLGRMAAMLAHDLRNSLSTVKVNIQILQGEEHDPALKDQWEIANDQITLMENVLVDMLTFARPSVPHKDWHDPVRIARNASLVFEPMAHAKDVQINLDSPHSLPRIKCDRTKVMQALQNLMDNAIHFAPHGSNITLQVEQLVANDEDCISFAVCDEGPGIAEEVAEALFDPFITNRPKGTGLGLAIVKKLAEQHNGQIRLNQLCDQGTCFRLILPIGVEDMDYEI